MYLDKQNEFSDAQAVTATAISANVIDTGVTDSDIGAGGDIYLVVQTQTAATSATSAATLTVTLESSAAAGLTSATTHFSTGALAFAAFSVAGTRLVAVKLPVGEYLRYLGVRYTVGTENLTAGAFDAFLTTDVSKYRAYPNGYVSAEE